MPPKYHLPIIIFMRISMKKWKFSAFLSFVFVFVVSCQQQTNSENYNSSTSPQVEQDTCYLCDKLELIYDKAIPVKDKKVQKTFWGISFGESVGAVYDKLKNQGLISEGTRFKTGSSSILGVMKDFGSSNCSYIMLTQGCQFAGHSFWGANIYFTPAPDERFFAIDFINVDDPCQLFLEIIKNYPIQKEITYPVETICQKDTIYDTIFEYQGPRRVVKNINKTYKTSYITQENKSEKGILTNYRYKNGSEIYVSKSGSGLLYIDNKILEEDIGNVSDL